ncbi:T9SS type B sorting domain-containing protein [Aquimarina sp. 2201CG14-23]|uniref:T9SS type B sorting domain-containing protein n=1 Tax=Aquimarina mycalae TaxID=3040073 RepID=UPI002477D346|nr:T9SS type B sorting domain-containing protein [Aquimarina sp. 2201CG14-23]MDH7446331.1 T9SS type B sorting domain-containing protein [Aquimarina sp. 2201CG14-23]
MKLAVHIRSAVILLTFLCIGIKGLVAQEVPFTTPLGNASSLTIEGDLQIISNAITGLSGDQSGTGNAFFIGDTTNYDPNDPYDGGAYNDQLTQDYIDVDSDASTFSSSSADFTASSTCAQIAYAGLYWSATYYIDRVDAANGNDAPQLSNLPLPDSRPDFKTVRLMMPGTTNYIDVTAEAGDAGTIYDGYRNTSTNPNDTASNDIPYVCYADITAELQSLADPATGEARADGTYTVANVRSATGLTESGSGISAGWVMVIIYEDPTLSRKFFSTNHGFLEIECESTSAFELALNTGTFAGQGVNHTQNNFSPGSVSVPNYPALLTADLVLVDDGNGTTDDGCQGLVNAAAVNGNIAVIRRGSCAFTQKVLNAQNAGAIAVVIVNNDGGNGTLTMTGNGTGITIPAVMIGNISGNNIITDMTGNTVNASLTDNLPVGCVNPPETFTYTGFQTLPPPNDIRARFGVAALEGDFGLVGDGLAIQAAPLGGFEIPLSADPVNGATNFFNSSISVDGNYNTARNPNSENTLGFDADIFDVPNTGNSVIGNNQTQVDFTASTEGDRYRIFLNTFSIEIIEPELSVFKRVLDINGVDITGGDVILGQQLFYEITVQNTGNESVTNAFIDDILPANVDYVGGTITTPSGVTATFTNGNREVRFDFADSVVERFDGPLTIRFGVEVVSSCSELRDACSNEIENIATATYTGLISTVTNSGEDSVLGQDACSFDIAGASNFLINLDSCDGNFSAFLCTGTLDLTAGGGFPNYVWTDLGTGAVVGNSQTLTVSAGGVYRVDKTGNPDCADLFEIWTVTAFNTVTNPVIDIANDPTVNGNIRTCPITGDALPEIFLCGATDSQYLDSGFVDATNIVWERLDPAACPAVTRDEDCPTLDSTCDPDWVQVATTRDFTVTDAGEYRIRVEFDGNCNIDFYFNVFKNNFEPNLVIVRDIVCNIPGTLRVQNSSTEYEYQLITPLSGTVIGYQASPEFTGLTEQGTYTVNVRQSNGLPTACVFQATQFMEELDSTVSITPVSPSCPSDQGEIQIQVTDGDSNYTYNISSTTTAFTASEGPTTDPNHIFTGLDPDVYDVEVLSYDGECIDTQQVTINTPAAFTATAILDADLSCTDAEIRIEVTGGSGNFVYSFQGNPASQQGSNIFVITADGTYTFTVADTTTGCTIDTNSVTVNPYTVVEATVAGTDPICPSGLGSILVTVTAGEGPFTYDLDAGTQVVTSNATTQTFSNITIGTHVINVFDRFGCAINTPINVTLTGATAITADIAITDDYRCDATGSPFIPGEITVSNPQNGNGNYEYSIDGTDFTNTTGVFGGLTDGTYTLYIRDTDTAACPVNLGDLTIDPLATVDDITFSVPGASNCVTQSFNITAIGQPVGPTYTYSITPAPISGNSTTGDFRLRRGIVYTITATNTASGCSYSEDFSENGLPEIQITSSVQTNPVTCNGGGDGEFSFTVINSTSFDYTITGPSTNITGTASGADPITTVIGSLPAGTYTIDIVDRSITPPANNCTDSAQVTITEPTNPITIDTAVATDAFCGNPVGTITVTASGGLGNFVYSLDNVTFQTSNVFTGLAAGSYTVYVNDDNGNNTLCTATTPVTINATGVPTLALAGGDLCYDTTNAASREITITGGVGPYTYSVNGGGPVAVATTPTFTIPNLTPGSYSVVVTDSNSCVSAPINFDIQPQLTITANLTKDITCAPNADATIEFVITGGNGTNVIDIIRDGTVIEANYTGGSPYSTSVGGTYEIRVTDAENCTATSAPIVVNPYIPLAATAVGTDPFCPADPGSILVTVTAGDGPYTYDLDGGAQTVTIAANTYTFNNVAIGAHTITVSDPLGCVLSPALNVTITAPTPITATPTLTQDYSCDAAGTGFIFGTITITGAANGNGSYEYSIDGTDFTNTTGVFTGLTDGTYTLYIRDTNTASCPVTLAPQITIDPLQEVTDLDFTLGQVQCPALESTVVVAATGTNGPSTFEYRISAPAGSVTVFSINDTYNLAAGDTYTFEARTTADGCIYTEDITIDNIDAIVVNGTATAEPTCNADTDGSLSFEVTGVDLTATTYSYTVTGGNVPIAPINGAGETASTISDATVAALGNLGAGTYTITVTDDITNCMATDTVIINEPTVLGFTEVVDAADCGASTGIITITASGGRGGYEYELRDAAGVVVLVAYQASDVFTGLAGGTYTVFVRDGNSAAACEFSRQVIVGQTSPGSILAVTGGDACYDTTNQASQWITITGGVGPYTYILDGNAPVAVTLLAPPNPANTFEITGLTPGTYSLFVNDVNNCSTPAINFTIADELTIAASLTQDLTCIIGNENAIIDITTTGGNGGNTFELSTNGGAYVAYGGPFPFTTLTAGTYQFRVTDAAVPTACQAETAIITVTPAPAPVATVVPTDIFCNGDTTGIITFTIDTTVGTGPYETSIDNGGTFSSQTVYSGLAAGTYNYVVRDAKQCTLTGTVTVDEPDAITADIRATPVSCAGGTFSYGTVIVENVAGGTTGAIGYTYTLFNSDGTLVTAASALPAVFTTGNTVTTTVDNFTFGEVNFGTYYITVEDENSCLITTSTVTVSSPPDDLDIVFEPGPSDCNATGAVYDIAIVNGASPYQIRLVGEPAPLGTFNLTNGLATNFPGPPFIPDASVGGNLHRFTGLLFGVSYIVEIQDAGGCIYRETLAPQTNVASPTVTLDTLSNISCNGLTDGSITVDVTAFAGVGLQWELFNSATGASILTNNDAAATDPYSLNIPNLGIGNYTLAVATPTDPFCTGTINFSITEPPLLELVFISQTAANCNIDAEVVVNGQGGTPPYQYAAVLDGAAAPAIGAYGPSSTLVLDPALGLDWDIYVIDSSVTVAAPGFCSAGPLDVSIVETPDPVFTSVPNFVDDPCTFDNDYTLTVLATGSTALEFGIDDGDTGTADAPVFVAGTPTGNPNEYTYTYTIAGPSVDQYTLTVRDANGCFDTDDIIVYEELIVDADFSTEPNCTDADGQITVTVTGGSDFTVNPGNFTFVLTGSDSGGSPVGPISQTGAGGNIFTLVSVGTYTVTVTDIGIGPAPAGCSASDDVSRVIPNNPTVVATPTNTLCVGATDGSILVTTPVGPDTPYTYQLFDFTGGVQGLQIGPDQTDDPLFDGLGDGEYLVIVTSTINGCTAQDDATIVDPSQVMATPSQNTYSCAADNSEVFPDITIDIVDGTPPYTISYTGPSITVTNQPVTGTQFIIDADVAGNYDITVTDSNNCPFVIPTVVVPAFPAITGETVVRDATAVNLGAISCDNPETVLVSIADDGLGTGDYIFEVLETGAIVDTALLDLDAQFTLPDVGIYTFEITDERTGCSVTTTYEVMPFDTIAATLNLVTDVLCFGDTSGEVNLNITGYTGTYNYTVTNTVTSTVTATGAGDTAVSNPLLIGTLLAGTYEVTVEALDAPFCDETTNRATIAQPAELTLDFLSATTANCNEALSDVVVDADGGVGPYNYAYVAGVLPQPNPGTFPESDTFSLDPLVSLNWVVFVQDANGCIVSTQIAIPAPTPDPVLDPIPPFVDDACNFDNDYTFTVTASGFGQLTYQLDAGVPEPGNVSNTEHQFMVTGPGTYTVTVYDGNNCPSNQESITVLEELIVDATFTTDPTCLDANGTITATVTGGSGGVITYTLEDLGPPVSVFATNTTGVFINVPAGDYRVIALDPGASAAGCTDDFLISFDVPEEPILVLEENEPVSCIGDSDGFILVSLQTGTDGDSPFVYELYDFTGGIQGALLQGPQTDDPLFDGLAAGDYQVIVTSANSCVDTLEPITIASPTQVTATASQNTYSCDPTDNSEIFPDITVDIVDGTPPYSISYTGPGITVTNQPVTGTQFIIDADVSGNYDITVFDDNNCSFAVPTEVVNPFPIMTNPTVTLVDRITCDAPNAEVVTVSVDRITGNVAGFEFDVLPVGGTDVQTVPEDVSGTTTATVNLPAVGNYVIRITDLDTGCYIDTAPYEVAPFDTIIATAALVTDVACFGDSNGEINLDVSMYTGTYNYTVTNTVTSTVTATGSGDTAVANPLLIGSLPAGTYEIFVEALDTPFCDETTNRVTLASPAELAVAVNPVSAETCNPGDDASIQAVGTGGTGTIEYQLEQPAGTPLIAYGVVTNGLFENLDAGTYTVSVRDASLCVASQDITINAPTVTSVVAVETSSLLCFDSVDAAITATASGGQGPGTYLFSITNPNGTTSAQFTSTTDTFIFNDLGPGTYTINVTDNLNCESTDTVTITAPTEVMVTVDTVRDPSCTDPTADIQVTGSGGTPPYEYSIDGVTFVAGDTFTSLVEGDYQFYVRDDNGCIGGPSNTVPVRAPEDLAVVLDLGNTAIICFSQATGSIDSEVTGGLGNYMYTLIGTDYLGVGVNIGPQTESFFGDLLAGDYTYRVTSEDCGPEDTVFTITQPTEFVALATTEDITCNGETDGRIVVTATGGTAPYFYSLYDSAGNALFTFLEDDIDGVAGEHIFDELAADTYRVEVEDINGCPETILDLIINEPLAIDGSVLSTTAESCAGFADGTATVSITGGTIGPDPLNPVYFWSIDGVTFLPVADPANLVITDLPGGITTLFIRDFNNSPNCEFPLNLDITPGVVLNGVLSDRIDCPVIDPVTGAVVDEIYYIDFILGDDSVTTDIIYSLVDPNDNTIVFDSNMTGTFTVNPGTYEGLMLHASGCEMSAGTIEVEEYTPLSVPIAQMTGNAQDPNEYEIIVTGGSGDYTYFVAIIPNGSTVNDLTDADYRELDENIFSIDETAEYALRVVDNLACEVIGIQELTFINIVIPNYFTPDGDGTNDVWYPRQDSSNPAGDPFFFSDMEVKVFDRYGRLLAEFVGDEEGWDGIYQGSELPSGDYWFTIILNDIDNREFTGHFTLYR